MQVSGERAKSANARHECFVMDARVSVKTAETAELDEHQASRDTLGILLLSDGKAIVSARLTRAIENRPERQQG